MFSYELRATSYELEKTGSVVKARRSSFPGGAVQFRI